VEACDQITALCRGKKAQKLSIKLKKSTIIITKVCRGKWQGILQTGLEMPNEDWMSLSFMLVSFVPI
jgi:hypothetical protein